MNRKVGEQMSHREQLQNIVNQNGGIFRTSIERAEIFVDYGKIDFGFMDRFISAVKKLAIKEVVLYSDRKIAATRKAALSTRCEV